jgi:hypothetical protein
MYNRSTTDPEDAVRQPGDPERRAEVRYPCPPERASRVVVSDGHAASWARPCDVSAGGMSLVTAHPYEPGTLLAIRLRARRDDPGPGLLATVVYAVGDNAGTWRLGCAFDQPLPPETLRAFL